MLYRIRFVSLYRVFVLGFGFLLLFCTACLAGAADEKKAPDCGNIKENHGPIRGEVKNECTTGNPNRINVQTTGTGCSSFDAMMDAYKKADQLCTGANDPQCGGKCIEDKREWACNPGAVHTGKTKMKVTEKKDETCPNGIRYTANLSGPMECECGCWK